MDKTLLNMENELKKRLVYPYHWGTKQTDALDKQTRFIYQTKTFKNLLEQINTNFETMEEKEQLKNYALNRWFNFHSAQAVENIFKAHPLVTQTDNPKDKEKDFFIEGIPFDHKTTVFPKKFEGTFNEAINQPEKLIEWLYKHQSQQGRYHLKNRLFVVLYNSNGKHWKLKANLQKIEGAVHQYLNEFSANQLRSFSFKKEAVTLSDLIWVLG